MVFVVVEVPDDQQHPAWRHPPADPLVEPKLGTGRVGVVGAHQIELALGLPDVEIGHHPLDQIRRRVQRLPLSSAPLGFWRDVDGRDVPAGMCQPDRLTPRTASGVESRSRRNTHRGAK